jgi:hypothetical protein
MPGRTSAADDAGAWADGWGENANMMHNAKRVEGKRTPNPTRSAWPYAAYRISLFGRRLYRHTHCNMDGAWP